MSSDLISRQAAIDKFEPWLKVPGYSEGELNMLKAVLYELRHLPSAERRGRWIRTGEDGYCSICNCDMPMYKEDWEWRYLETPYCPNCGARMEETP